MQQRTTLWGGILLALLAALFFSIKAIFVKLAYQYGVDAITLLSLRMGFALFSTLLPVFMLGAAIQRIGALLVVAGVLSLGLMRRS